MMPSQSLSPYARLWSLAWPLMLSNISVPLVGLVDTAVLGHLDSANYLGAVAVGANLFTILYWSFGFLRMGTTGMAAQAQGARDDAALRRLLIQSLCLGAALGSLLLLLQRPLIQLGLHLMNPSSEVAELARQYCLIRIFSAPAVLVQYAVIGWLIGRHDTRSALAIAVCMNLINLLLDLLFVVGLGMTSEGVALASLLAEWSAVVLGVWLIHSRHRRLWAAGTLGERLGHWPDYLNLIQVNRYLFVRTIVLLLVFAFFTAQGAQMGNDILAANAVLLTFLLLISTGLDGFANGVEVMAGEAVGAKRLDWLVQSIRVSLVCAALSAVAISGFFALAGSWLIHWLTDLQMVRDLARLYLPWLIVLPVVAVWGYLLDGIFIGATQVRAMQHTMVVSAALCLVAWWLTRQWGNHGLWFSLSLFMLTRGLSLAAVAAWLSKRSRWL